MEIKNRIKCVNYGIYRVSFKKVIPLFNEKRTGYPHKYEVTENEANLAIELVEKTRNIKSILELRNI